MNPILVELTRGTHVESVHRGSIAIADATGKLVASWGNADALVFPRSAFKAFQALPLVETGAADALEVSAEELALACASHSGEAMHVERVARWLGRIGCSEGDLACFPHLPYHEPSAHALLRAGERPSRLHNNCSGKHAGFLTVARHLDATVAGYERPDHPVQILVREAIASLCGLRADTMPMGIDGCAAPNYAISLANLAAAMARFGTGEGLSRGRAEAAARLRGAWRGYPKLISGTDRACAAMIEASSSDTVVKTGAEGVFTAVLPARGLGVVLKIDDGATRAAETAMARVLVLLHVASEAALARYTCAPVLNLRGERVGERRPTVVLDRLDQS